MAIKITCRNIPRGCGLLSTDMEIDFLGLNSPKYGKQQRRSEGESRDIDNGGVETSLSLSTTCSTDCHREKLSSSQKRSKGLGYYNHGQPPQTEQSGVVLLARPVFVPPSTGFLYDLNSSPEGLRSVVSKLPPDAAASLAMLYSGGSSPERVASLSPHPRISPVSGSTRLPTLGYTPTVAMARRATLARFLEKRLHRINQMRTSHFMGKLMNPEAPPASGDSARSNKKRVNDSNLISL